MTCRIAHLSDLHFGRDDARLGEALVAAVNAAEVELVVVSGDLTQRARDGQFRAARAFMDRFDAPVIAVPGNHDTPLDNLAVRLLRPWSRWRRHIARSLEPVHEGADYVVCGLNTADPRSWQRGRMRMGALGRVGRGLGNARSTGRLGIVAMHHPPDANPGKRAPRGARAGLGALAEQGADVILCGHLHVWRVGPVATEEGVLLVQAGTGLSTRVRGEPNDFNILTVEDAALLVERHGATSDGARFVTLSKTPFRKVAGRWHRMD